MCKTPSRPKVFPGPPPRALTLFAPSGMSTSSPVVSCSHTFAGPVLAPPTVSSRATVASPSRSSQKTEPRSRPHRPFIPKSRIAEIAQTGLTFKINGQVKQAGTAADMIFDVPQLISFVSGIMKLEVRPFFPFSFSPFLSSSFVPFSLLFPFSPLLALLSCCCCALFPSSHPLHFNHQEIKHAGTETP